MSEKRIVFCTRVAYNIFDNFPQMNKSLDTQTGRVVIVRSVEGYDQKGEYFFDKEVVGRGTLDKKQGGSQR